MSSCEKLEGALGEEATSDANQRTAYVTAGTKSATPKSTELSAFR